MDQDNKQPATVDYYNRVEVVQHFRDMINMSRLLENGLEEEVSAFRKLLEKRGWQKEGVQSAYEDAAKYTIFEPLLPPVIKDGNSN